MYKAALVVFFLITAHSNSSSNVAVLLHEAISHHQQGNTELAARLYHRFLSSNVHDTPQNKPQHALALHNLAIISFGNGDRGRALDFVEASIQVESHDPNTHHTQGVLLRALGQHEDAVLSFQSALRIAPDMVNAHLGLANTLHYGVADPLQLETQSFERYQSALRVATEHYELALQHAGHRCENLDHNVSNVHVYDGEEGMAQSDVVSLLNDMAIALQKSGRFVEASAALRCAVEVNPSHLQSLGNLAVVLKELGDLNGAASVGKRAARAAPGNAQVHFNLGLTLQALGDHGGAEVEWYAALQADSTLWQAKESLGHVEGHRGNLSAARAWYQSALDTLLESSSPPLSAPLLGEAFSHRDEEEEEEERGADKGAQSARGPAVAGADALRLQIATACVPQIYDSTAHISAVRLEYANGLRSLLGLSALPAHAPCNGEEGPPVEARQRCPGLGEARKHFRRLAIPSPLTSTGSGAMGYYLIYTGHNDVGNRRLLASVYWRSSPVLRFAAPFLLHQHSSSSNNDEKQQQQHVLEKYSATKAAAVAVEGNTLENRALKGGELRVGFMSAFFFHHSVGLLMRGVITGLAQKYGVVPGNGGGGDDSLLSTRGALLHHTRDDAAPLPPRPKLHLVLLYSADTPPPGDAGSGGGDPVFEELLEAVQHAVALPPNDLPAAQRLVADQRLDLLVFAEVGMDRLNYFLAFSRLAHRSALFWGHATTSGIAPVDDLDDDDDRGGGGGGAQRRGGIDYFVSSELFESPFAGQRRYTERLYLMRGLTTSFVRPPPPLPPSSSSSSSSQDRVDDANQGEEERVRAAAKALAKELGLPPLEPFLGEGHGGGGGGGGGEIQQQQQQQSAAWHLYLVPQTLYKLHPDFDALIKGVLEADPCGIVAMPQANEDGWTERASKRIANSLGDHTTDPSRRTADRDAHPHLFNSCGGGEGPGRGGGGSDLRSRVVTVRRLRFWEFSLLARMAHVVLDPFPVGGGRSSFEVLAVGTPIVLLYPRTSILQLTHGMYQAMGLVHPPHTHCGDGDGEGGSGGGNDKAGEAGARSGGKAGQVSSPGEGGRVLEVLVTHSPAQFVASAVAVGTNATLRAALHAAIESASHLLYAPRPEVVDEWAEFAAFACAAPRPNPTVAWWRTSGEEEEEVIEERGGGGEKGRLKPGALRARWLFAPESTTAVESGESEQEEEGVLGWPSEEVLTRAVTRAAEAERAYDLVGEEEEQAGTSDTSRQTRDLGAGRPLLEGAGDQHDIGWGRGDDGEDDDGEEEEEEEEEDDAIAAGRAQVITFEVSRDAFNFTGDTSASSGSAFIRVNGERTKLRPRRLSKALGWRWAKRPGIGWEYEPTRTNANDDDDEEEEWPNERAHGLAYAVKLAHEDSEPSGGFPPRQRSFLVEVWAPSPRPPPPPLRASGSQGVEAAAAAAAVAAEEEEEEHQEFVASLEAAADSVARNLSSLIRAEPVKAHWISCLLRRGALMAVPPSSSLRRPHTQTRSFPRETPHPLEVATRPRTERPSRGKAKRQRRQRLFGEEVWTLKVSLVDAVTKEPLEVAHPSRGRFSWGTFETPAHRHHSQQQQRRPASALFRGNSAEEKDEEGRSEGGAVGGGFPVRFGADLSQLASWVAYRYDLSDGAAAWLRQHLEGLTPEHASDPAWVEARASACASTFAAAAVRPSPLRSPCGGGSVGPRGPSELGAPSEGTPKRRHAHSAKGSAAAAEASATEDQSIKPTSGAFSGPSPGCRITVGITTCKRLSLFRRTAQSLLDALGPSHFKPTAAAPASSSSSSSAERGASSGVQGNAATDLPLVCRVVVVDDGSSDEDVVAMRREFPWFEFVLKPPHRKGHADSLNLLLDLFRSSSSSSTSHRAGQQQQQQQQQPESGDYFMYLEDDWLFLPQSNEHGGSNASLIAPPKALSDAVAILDVSRAAAAVGRVKAVCAEKLSCGSGSDEDGRRGWGECEGCVSEVLLNDQSSRECAYAVTHECLHVQPTLGSAGWARTLAAAPDIGGEEGLAFPPIGTDPVHYRFHEFGCMAQPECAFGYWPGFSLNPGVWDVAALDAKLMAAAATAQAATAKRGVRPAAATGETTTTSARLRFNTTGDRRFEQSMSLRLAAAGVRVAYLPRMTFRHLGVETSAYELNGMARPWDRAELT